MYDEDRPAEHLPCAEGLMGSLVRDTALRRFLILLVISAGFTALVIQFSYAHGKLACPPFYDDVAYFEDALRRLEILHSSGLGSVILDYARTPPHSAFSSFLAAGAFATMGVHDWAPYVANGLIILALLGFVNYLTNELPLAYRLGLMLVVLCVPISAMAVHEFRPDIPSALCAGMGTALLLWRPFTGATWRYRAAAGALFGLGAVFKPPTSPLTVIVFFAALAASVAIDVIVAKPPIQLIWRAIGQCIAAALAVSLPHFLVDWRNTYAYIYQNIFGSSHSTWARQGTLGWHLRYYFDGPGGAVMLGGMAWPLVAIAVIGLMAFLVAQRGERALRLSGMLVVALAAYAVPAAMDVKEPFFGTTFVWVMVFAAVFVFDWVMDHKGWLPVVLLVVACCVGLAAGRLGQYLYDRGSPIVRDRNRVVDDIYADLIKQGVSQYSRVYMTTTGYVNPGVLDYYFRRDTLHAMNVDAEAFSDDVAGHARQIGWADYVVASEPGNGLAYGDFVRSGLVQDQTLAVVRSNADFRQVGAYPTSTGKHYFLFRRTYPFFGWVDPKGLVPVAPAQPGGRFVAYVATGASTRLTIPANSPAKLRLVGQLTCSAVPLHVRCTIDGRGNRDRFYNEPGTAGLLTFVFAPHGGGEHSVEITYDPPATPQRPVMFSQLEIIPDEQK